MPGTVQILKNNNPSYPRPAVFNLLCLTTSSSTFVPPIEQKSWLTSCFTQLADRCSGVQRLAFPDYAQTGLSVGPSVYNGCLRTLAAHEPRIEVVVVSTGPFRGTLTSLVPIEHTPRTSTIDTAEAAMVALAAVAESGRAARQARSNVTYSAVPGVYG